MMQVEELDEQGKELIYDTALTVAQTIARKVVASEGAKIILDLALDILKLRWNS